MRILAANPFCAALVDTDAGTMAISDLPRRALEIASLVVSSRAEHVMIEPPGRAPHYAIGAVEAACAGLMATLNEVRPAIWRKATATVADERQHATRASQLFPAHHAAFAGRAAPYRAQAALLAWYGASTLDRPPAGALRVAEILSS